MTSAPAVSLPSSWLKQHEPVAQQPRHEEVPAHVLLAAQRALPRRGRVVEDLEARLRALLGRVRVDEPAGLAVLDLRRRSRRRGSPTVGRVFQSASVTVRPKPSLDRLLDHGVRVHLEGVDLDRADVVQVREDVDVGVAVGVGDGAVVVVPALGVVVRHRADERELHVGMLGLDDPVGVDHAERVLPGVEARDLRQQRPLDVDPELVDDVGRVLGRERHVLRGQRVDRRRPDVGRRQARRRAARTPACGRSPRRSARATAAGSRARRGSACERSMWQRQIQCACDCRGSARSSRPAAGRGRARSRTRPRTPRRSAPGSGGRPPAASASARVGRPGARCGSSS